MINICYQGADTNPYAKLMSHNDNGIIKNYENIRSKRIAIVGLGCLRPQFLHRTFYKY